MGVKCIGQYLSAALKCSLNEAQKGQMPPYKNREFRPFSRNEQKSQGFIKKRLQKGKIRDKKRQKEAKRIKKDKKGYLVMISCEVMCLVS